MVESLQEYLARGGQINIIPPPDRSEDKHTLPVKTHIDFDSLSLGESEYLFGEVRSRKANKVKPKVSSDDFSKMIEASNLPASVMEALKKAMRK